MFALKKAISPFLVPPGIFIVILAFSGLYMWRRSRKAAIINLAIAVFIWALAIRPVSNRLMRGLEAGLSSRPQGDVIVMLGGGLRDGLPTGDTLARIVAAARLYQIIHAPVIISGGPVFGWRRPEAVVDVRFLEREGVPPGKIISEEKSRDTLQNAEYSAQICERYHFKRPVVVTSAYHMKRALLCFGHFGMRAAAFPAWPAKKAYHWTGYLPKSFRYSRTALHEYLGIVYLKILFGAQKIIKSV